MHTPPHAEIVRHFTRRDTGARVTVRFGVPEADPLDAATWRCLVTIDGLDATSRARWIHGVDAVQALGLALFSTEVELQVAPGVPPIDFLGQPALDLPRLPGMLKHGTMRHGTVYEVAATVREDRRQAYEAYMLTQHIADVMATGCFVGASLERGEHGHYVARYVADGREALARYLAEHAPRLREHFLEMLPDGVTTERTIREQLSTWPL